MEKLCYMSETVSFHILSVNETLIDKTFKIQDTNIT